MTGMSKPPVDLCAEHRRIWMGWRDLRYNPRHPQEWPGGSIIMDSRTSHATREADWDRKSREQMDLTEHCCRSGWSPQCTGAELAPDDPYDRHGRPRPKVGA